MKLRLSAAALLLLFTAAAQTVAPDSELRRLLAYRGYSTDNASRLAHARACERALAESPDSPLRVKACRRVGDIYYMLGKYRKTARWYREALKIDPSLKATTLIGFRLAQYDRIVKRNIILFSVYAVYGLLLSLLAARIIRNRRTFDWRFLVKSAALWGGIVLAVQIGFLLIDNYASSRIAFAMTSQEASDMRTGLPAVPFSFLDSSNIVLGGTVLLIGLLPVLLVAVYHSCKTGSSVIAAALIGVLSAGALWTHFITATAFDHALTPIAHVLKQRIWYDGELEDMLVEDPQKVVRANPGILQSGNRELEMFIRMNFPQGLKVRKEL